MMFNPIQFNNFDFYLKNFAFSIFTQYRYNCKTSQGHFLFLFLCYLPRFIKDIEGVV